jgi:nucleoside-diphosphate-sugar epimerase
MTISILGCGWLGLALASELIQSGYEIKGSTRSVNKLEKLVSYNISPFLVDLSKMDAELLDFLDSEIVIISIPPKNLEHFKYLQSQLEKANVQKVIFISSTSVYPNSHHLITEDHPLRECQLAEIEQLFQTNDHFRSTIIRFGGLFGYDRKPGHFIKADNIIKNPDGTVNLIHRDDCIAIIQQIIQKDIWNETFNACADAHPTRKDFYQKEMLKVGRSTIIIEDDSTEYGRKIISNNKLKTQLAYEFKYPDLMKY